MARRAAVPALTAVLVASPAVRAEEAEPRWGITADVVGGATNTDVLSPVQRARVSPLSSASVVDGTRARTFSFIFGLERDIDERLTLGVRVPVVEAELVSRTGMSSTRRVFAAGNVELGAQYALLEGDSWRIVPTLEVALPTASGTEQPDDVENVSPSSDDFRSYDRFAVVHAGTAVRGAYESALFEPGHLGIVPKVSARFRFGDLTLQPMVKLENLFRVTGDSNDVWLREFVASVDLGYRVVPTLEPGAHIWMRELHEHKHSEDSFGVIGVVEPYARFHFDGVSGLEGITTKVSAILPFAGELVEARTFGVRLVIAGEL